MAASKGFRGYRLSASSRSDLYVLDASNGRRAGFGIGPGLGMSWEIFYAFQSLTLASQCQDELV